MIQEVIIDFRHNTVWVEPENADGYAIKTGILNRDAIIAATHLPSSTVTDILSICDNIGLDFAHGIVTVNRSFATEPTNWDEMSAMCRQVFDYRFKLSPHYEECMEKLHLM